MVFKLILSFRDGQWKFLFLQKNRGHFWTLFGSKFDHFLRNCTSDLSKTWSETWDSCFESFNGSVVSRKILVLAVLAIFGSKIHCLWWHYMVLGWFWPFSSKPLMIFVNFLFKPSLLFKNSQWKFLFWQKNGAIFGPFFGPKFGHFRSKIRCSVIFFETTHLICLKLGQKLGTIALNHRMVVFCLGIFCFWPF